MLCDSEPRGHIVHQDGTGPHTQGSDGKSDQSESCGCSEGPVQGYPIQIGLHYRREASAWYGFIKKQNDLNKRNYVDAG